MLDNVRWRTHSPNGEPAALLALGVEASWVFLEIFHRLLAILPSKLAATNTVVDHLRHSQFACQDPYSSVVAR
jgi:hypothetical protein